MPNDKGWYTKEEVQQTGLPYYIPRSDKWTGEPYKFAVLLSKSRCMELGMPILKNGHEMPSAFKYSANAGAGTGDLNHRYVPLYDRTSAAESGVLEVTSLFKGETMGSMTVQCPECGGGGFSAQGTGYDDVCGTCAGQGEIIAG